MTGVTHILQERVEIGRVVGNGDYEWMMFVCDGDDTVDAGFYLTREGAVAAAETWGLSIRFVHEVGSVEVAEVSA
jgi:hypothetical protein